MFQPPSDDAVQAGQSRTVEAEETFARVAAGKGTPARRARRLDWRARAAVRISERVPPACCAGVRDCAMCAATVVLW